MNIERSIFREYDIRGTYPEQINESSIKLIAHAIAIRCKKDGVNTLVVGRDGRLSGPSLLDAFCSGLLESGINVNNIGLVTSPLLYYAAKKSISKSGVMITGSHNPKNYNGIKMVINDNPISGTEIYSLISNKDIDQVKNGEIEYSDIKSEYIDEVCKNIFIKKPESLKIVLDCGNGSAGCIAPDLFKKLGFNVIELFSEVDGNFPNHHPDPTDESTLKILSDKMKEVNADIGIGFDGDGDRIGVIDKKGRPIAGDLLTAFLSNSLEINDKENQTVILDIKSSYVAYDKIISFGLNAEIGKTGHSNIKKRIKEINSPLAGEMSGHIFFADKYYGYDDALYTSIRIISLMANDNNLDDFISTLPKTYVSPEIKLYCSDKIKFQLINRLIDKVLKDYNPENVITLDGVRAKNEMGWWLIRASNTEEAIVVRFEGKSEKDQDKLLIEVKERLKNEGLTWEYS